MLHGKTILTVSVARLLRQATAVLTASFVTVSPAAADVCRSLQAQLATIPSASNQARAVQKTSAEISRLSYHMQSIGCDRQSFLMFGQPPPPECRGYQAQLNQMRASIGPYQNTAARRQQLMAMQISNNCRTQSAGPLTGGFFDNGSRRSSLEVRPSMPIDPEPPPPRIEARIRGTGGKAVCVRLCDGYHFPLDQRRGSLRETGDESCQSLCPESETKVFLKPGDIETAHTPEGENYTALPNAFRYRKTFDASCFCRQPGESMAKLFPQVLNPADDAQIADPFREDELISQDIPLRGASEEPNRSSSARRRPLSLFGDMKLPEPPSPPQPPPDVSADRLVTVDQGEVRESRNQQGLMRKVRVIAPELAPALSAAEGPSTLGRAPSP